MVNIIKKWYNDDNNSSKDSTAEEHRLGMIERHLVGEKRNI